MKIVPIFGVGEAQTRKSRRRWESSACRVREAALDEEGSEAAISDTELREQRVISVAMEIALGKTDTYEREAGIVRRKRRWRAKILGDKSGKGW